MVKSAPDAEPAATEVLVIDDQEELSRALRSELEAHGYVVRTARTGAEALAWIEHIEFEVILLDVRLTDVDGVEVLKTTRERSPETQVVVMTGYASLATAIECLRAGAFDFIEKPFRAADVVATIDRAVERRRQLVSTALYEACQVVFTADDVERLPELIVDTAMKVTGADDVSLMLPDPRGRLCVAHSSGLSSEVRDATGLLPGERVAGRVALDRKPALLRGGLDADPRFAGVESLRPIRSSIVYPLLSGERLVGVLNLNRVEQKRPFHRSDLHRVAVLASQVVLALENARLVRHVVATERFAAVGQIAAGVAHEINNPVCYVLTNLREIEELSGQLSALSKLIDQGAKRDTIDAWWQGVGGHTFVDDLKQAAQDAHEGARRIRDIVRDMRALARPDEDVRAEFDLNEVIRSAIRVANAEIRRRAALTLQMPGELPVFGSAGRMSQVFVNLLVNAAHAIAEAGGQGHRITISSRADGDSILVDVSDTGAGIGPENLPRIFEPFFTTKSAGMGTGLGLSISREIVRRHGGDIHVRSELGRGTTFTLVLPAARVGALRAPEPSSETRIAIAPPISPAARAATGDRSSRPPRRARVLFVDDEPGIRRSYQRTFGRDHDVTVARGGADALAILSTTQDFDLVVCDLLMPDVTGMEVYRQASTRYPHLRGRFVFVTGGLMQREVRSFLRTVGNQVLEKPFDVDALKRIIVSRSEKRAQGVAMH